jgi:hypothetical protein
MLFDPKVGLSVKGRIWQEGREGEREQQMPQWNEGKPELELGNVTWSPKKGHLTPKFKVVKETACDYVWDKLHPPLL